MSVGFRPTPPPPEPPAEVPLWTLTKAARRAEACVRLQPFGHELGVSVDGHLVFSSLFKPGDRSRSFDAESERVRLAFVELGWQPDDER